MRQEKRASEEMRILETILLQASNSGAFYIAEVEENGVPGRIISPPGYNGGIPFFTNGGEAYHALDLYKKEHPKSVVDVFRVVVAIENRGRYESAR